MPKKTTTKNSEENFEPFNISDLPWEQFPGSDRFKRLGGYAGAGRRAGHHLYNHTNADCTSLTIGESKQDEVCYFPKSGKVRIRSTGDVLKTSQTE